MVHSARTLIDQDSESSFASESLVQRLRLQRSAKSVFVYGVGGKMTSIARSSVNVRLIPDHDDTPIAVSTLVLPQLTLYDDGLHAVQGSWKHIAGLRLADPDYLAADPVELILGADVGALIFRPGFRVGGPQEPMA